MRKPTFWRNEGIVLGGLFLTSYVLSLVLIVLFPAWPSAGVPILGGVVLAALGNVLIHVWKRGDTSSQTRHLADQTTKLVIGLGLLLSFFVTLSSFSTDAAGYERWMKVSLMVTTLAPGIFLVLRPLRTILFFVTKPWRR